MTAQVVVVPLRVNVNLKAVTVEDLVFRRKVGSPACKRVVASLSPTRLIPAIYQGLQSAMTKNLRCTFSGVS